MKVKNLTTGNEIWFSDEMMVIIHLVILIFNLSHIKISLLLHAMRDIFYGHSLFEYEFPSETTILPQLEYLGVNNRENKKKERDNQHRKSEHSFFSL